MEGRTFLVADPGQVQRAESRPAFPPTITQSIPVKSKDGSGPSSGSRERNRTRREPGAGPRRARCSRRPRSTSPPTRSAAATAATTSSRPQSAPRSSRHRARSHPRAAARRGRAASSAGPGCRSVPTHTGPPRPGNRARQHRDERATRGIGSDHPRQGPWGRLELLCVVGRSALLPACDADWQTRSREASHFRPPTFSLPWRAGRSNPIPGGGRTVFEKSLIRPLLNTSTRPHLPSGSTSNVTNMQPGRQRLRFQAAESVVRPGACALSHTLLDGVEYNLSRLFPNSNPDITNCEQANAAQDLRRSSPRPRSCSYLFFLSRR